jgi:tRNA(fMet)-specific endonuclease VapC
VNRRYMLDTNTVSYIIKGKSPASRTKLAELKHGEIACISATTEAEIEYGLAKSPNAELLRSAVEGFLAKIQILPWGSEEARAYGGLRAEQEAAGKPLGNLDMLIAAHAISVGAILVTNDKAFLQVSTLPATVNWAKDL